LGGEHVGGKKRSPAKGMQSKGYKKKEKSVKNSGVLGEAGRLTKAKAVNEWFTIEKSVKYSLKVQQKKKKRGSVTEEF